MMLKSMFLVFFSAYLLNFTAGSNCFCELLQNCTNKVTEYTLDHLSLSSKPSTEAQWTSWWQSKCNSIQEIVECTKRRKGCDDSWKIDAAWQARNVAHKLCKEPNGRKYFRRLYTVSDSCLGNEETVQQMKTSQDQCNRDSVIQDISRAATLSQEDCRRLNDVRNCEANVADEKCGYLGRFLTDETWRSRIYIHFEDCYDGMSPAWFSMPAEDTRR